MINYPQDGTELDVPGVPDDTKYLGDKLDILNATIGQLAAALARGAPNTGIYFAMGAPSAAGAHNDFPQNVRIRIREFVVSVSGAATVTITVGTAAYAKFDFAAATTMVIPMPDTFDAGVDVVVSISAGTLRAAYFTGTPDE